MANEGIADIFLEIADLLDLEGVKFKPEAYRRAARTLQQLPEDVKTLVAKGTIDDVPGIGKALAQKVRDYVATGEVPYLAKLRAQWPPGLLALMRLEGVGPKTTRRFFVEFQVKGPEDLKQLLDKGGLQGVFGFGDKKIELLQKALDRALAAPGGVADEARRPLPEAQVTADDLLAALRAIGAPVETLVFAGSLRRRKETVGDLDILATSGHASEVMAKFTALPDVAEVRLSGPTKSTVVLKDGLQVDLRVVAPEAFGAALQYFTGSKDHNIHLRSLANQKGLSINEYGLARKGTLVPARTEEEVYAAVGLPWIPPECREDQGEIEAAQAGKLPMVVKDSDLRGELHIHVPSSVARDDLEPWARALQARGLVYGGFVVDHAELSSEGRPLGATRQSIPSEILGVKIRWGLEAPWGTDLASSQNLSAADFLIWRPPERPSKDGGILSQQLGRKEARPPSFLAHLEEGALKAAGLTWTDLVAPGPQGVPLEIAVTSDAVITPTPQVREAARSGSRVVLSGRPRVPEELARLDLAAGTARRGWIVASNVVNAGSPFGEAGREPGQAAPAARARKKVTSSVSRPRQRS